jgi:hypothetical protein
VAWFEGGLSMTQAERDSTIEKATKDITEKFFQSPKAERFQHLLSLPAQTEKMLFIEEDFYKEY